jgi:hypothetical protein
MWANPTGKIMWTGCGLNWQYHSPGTALLPLQLTAMEERDRRRESERDERRRLREECERNPLF